MTRNLSVYLGSLALLLVATLASSRVGREVNVADFPVERLPARLAGWVLVPPKGADQARAAAPAEEEAIRHCRAYRNADGLEVAADFKVTSSRLGALRDYATAMIGRGWTPGPALVWEADLPPVPFRVRACTRTLRQASARHYTLNWYVSPGEQALTLREAVLTGWRQRATGNSLWGQVYLTVASAQEDAAAQQAVTALARELLPAFYAVLEAYAGRQAAPSSRLGERK